MSDIGQRIRQARVAAAMSLRDLSLKAAPLTHTAIANYESGKDTPRAEVLLRLGRSLGVEPEYFFRETRVELSCARYRKSSKLLEKQQRSIEERIREHLERYLEVESVFPPGYIAPSAFSRDDVTSVSDLEEVEAVASDLRRRWDMGTLPINNLADALEDRGVRVLLLSADGEFDGFSCWANGKIPVIIASLNKPWDRQRFDLAHELGELLLSPTDGVDREKAAHRFASAFLAPRDAVIRELGPTRARLSFEELRLLKEEWGLSMQAWVFRARDVGVLSPAAFSAMYRRLSAAGLRKDEGTPHRPPEEPWRFVRLVEEAKAEGFITPSRAAGLLRQIPSPRPRKVDPERLRQAVEAAQSFYQSDLEAVSWISDPGEFPDGEG